MERGIGKREREREKEKQIKVVREGA